MGGDKHEIRISKHETSTKFQSSKQEPTKIRCPNKRSCPRAGVIRDEMAMDSRLRENDDRADFSSKLQTPITKLQTGAVRKKSLFSTLPLTKGETLGSQHWRTVSEGSHMATWLRMRACGAERVEVNSGDHECESFSRDHLTLRLFLHCREGAPAGRVRDVGWGPFRAIPLKAGGVRIWGPLVRRGDPDLHTGQAARATRQSRYSVVKVQRSQQLSVIG